MSVDLHANVKILSSFPRPQGGSQEESAKPRRFPAAVACGRGVTGVLDWIGGASGAAARPSDRVTSLVQVQVQRRTADVVARADAGDLQALEGGQRKLAEQAPEGLGREREERRYLGR